MNKFLIFLFFFVSMPSYAYIGPGMGGGAIAAILGFLYISWSMGNFILPNKASIREEREEVIDKIS